NHYSAPDNWDPWLCFDVPPHIKLIIDAPLSDAVLGMYVQMLTELGYVVTINVIPPTIPPSTPTPGPPYDYLLQFDVVIWVTGNAYAHTILPEDAYNLGMYLDLGGKLLLTGQDIGNDIWQFSEPNDTTRGFYTNHLGAEYVQNNVELQYVDGEATGFLGSFQDVQITGYGGINYPDFSPDEVDANDYGMMAMQYDSSYYIPASQRPPSRASHRTSLPGMDEIISTGGACIASENTANNSRSIYLPFAFEGITDHVIRNEMMQTCLYWLYGSSGPPDMVAPVISVEENGIQMEWTASAGALSYRIYASDDDPNFMPDSSTLIGAVEEPFFADHNANLLREKRFYKVTAVGSVPMDSQRDALRNWLEGQTDVDAIHEELERRKIRHHIHKFDQQEYQTISSFNHHEATEPDHLIPQDKNTRNR
ncbi:hypothetical protein AMJ86_06095, partial [bacterium SM23_57]